MGTLNLGSSNFFLISLALYFVTMVLYILYVSLKNENLGKIATWFLFVSIINQAFALTLKTIEIKRLPFVSIYETLVFWSWLIALVYIILQIRFHIKALGAFVTPLAFFAIAAASILPKHYKQSSPLIPALQSHWLEFHIITAFAGYACFAVSFAASLAYLIKRQDLPDALLSKERLDNIGYKAISIGFPLLTLGIISGSIWANSAWGRYWGWDPKEVWSLITWFIYAVYLHLRIVAKRKGKMAALVSIIGFIAVIFTYIGVNFLLSGLHSYAG